jgi:nicotinate-nucleotide pyrophosphorylase (carboxylating)
MFKSDELDRIIDNALREDMPEGDITSENVVSQDSTSKAVITGKEEGILAGIEVAEKVFKKIDPEIRIKKYFRDGQGIKKGEKLAVLQGSSISLLKGERTALNFLQRMSGIATLTRRFVNGLRGSSTKLLDTRKTTPGLRILEKYAVKTGGGENHRFSLSDMVMLKDNHLRLVGDIRTAVERARANIRPGIKIEVETSNLKEVKEAINSGADMVMLDNMSLNKMREVVEWVNGRVPLEVSGKVDLDNIKDIALLGVDYVSVGSLTHSFKSLDISMNFF